MLMRHPHPELQFAYKLPYGAVVSDRGVQFVVFSRSATAMRVLLYDHVDDREPSEIIDFDRDTDRWGDVWSAFVPGIKRLQTCKCVDCGNITPSKTPGRECAVVTTQNGRTKVSMHQASKGFRKAKVL